MSQKINCIRKIHFCSGHRVYKHESKCANIHGHNYVMWVHATADQLDSVGRVIDFSVIKNIVETWINDNWDHTFLVYREDVELISQLKKIKQPKDIFICNFNPTSENMGKYILDICPELFRGLGVEINKITLYETENCYTEAIL